MTLARAALYAQGVDVYLAPTWDNWDIERADPAAHRQRGPDLRDRGHLLHPRRRLPPDLPGRADLYNVRR